MLWECNSCGLWLESDPTASDDWGDEEIACGPECPECEIPMDFVSDDTVDEKGT